MMNRKHSEDAGGGAASSLWPPRAPAPRRDPTRVHLSALQTDRIALGRRSMLMA